MNLDTLILGIENDAVYTIVVETDTPATARISVTVSNEFNTDGLGVDEMLIAMAQGLLDAGTLSGGTVTSVVAHRDSRTQITGGQVFPV